MTHPKHIQKSTVLMIVFWLSVIIVSVFSSLYQPEIGQLNSQLLMIVFIYAASYVWFIQDAKEEGHTPSKALMFGVVTAASICIPYYLLRHKGLKRSIVSVSKFAGCFVVSASVLGALPL